MNSQIKYVLILLLAQTIVGCNKPNLYLIEGRVVDGKSGMAVPKADIEVDFSKLENGTYSNVFVPTGATQTDDQGNYSLEFEAEKVIEFRVRTTVDQYFERIDTLSRDEWSSKNSNQYNIQLFRESIIDFHFFSKRTGITFLFKLDEHSPGCSQCCSNQNMVFSGMIDTTFSCPVYGNQVINYEGLRVSGSQTEEVSGSIEVYNGVQTFEYEIE